MKKLWLAGVAGVALAAAGSADAADLGTRPVYKAPPVTAPVPMFSWTGCYIGAHIGGGWGRNEFRDPAGPNVPGPSSGAATFFVGWLSPGTPQSHPPRGAVAGQL